MAIDDASDRAARFAVIVENDDEQQEEDERHRAIMHTLTRSTDSQNPEAFCDCFRLQKRDVVCTCGEDYSTFEWNWDNVAKSAAAVLSSDDREAKFHTVYSCGTAAVRGNQAMKSRQYYWEIKMTTPVYGTDMMVGIGTGDVDLDRFSNTFSSLLGCDCNSWGLSYTGYIQHRGKPEIYSSRFGQGSIIGVHLDSWHGTLSFFKNRQPLGIAYRNLRGKTLYPMLSSTAARSGMKVIRCCSFDSSLQYLCCRALRKLVPVDIAVLDAVHLPPGLRTFLRNNLSWLLSTKTAKSVPSEPVPSVSKRKACDDEEDGFTTMVPIRRRLL